MNVLYTLIIAGILVAIGDVALAQWSRLEEAQFLLLGLVFNLVGILLYAQTLSVEHIGIATALFLGLNIGAVTLSGIFLFNESLSSGKIFSLLTLLLGIILIEVIG